MEHFYVSYVKVKYSTQTNTSISYWICGTCICYEIILLLLHSIVWSWFLIGLWMCALLYVFTLLFFYLSSANRQTHNAISKWRRIYQSNSVVTQIVCCKLMKKRTKTLIRIVQIVPTKVSYSFRMHWYWYWYISVLLKESYEVLITRFFVFIHYFQNTWEITCFPVAKHVRKSRSTKKEQYGCVM